MKKLRSLQNAWGLLFLRVSAASLLFAGHGLDKLQHLSERAGSFPDPVGLGSATSLLLAVFAEAICSILVLLGLMTRLAVVPIIATLLVAALVVHGDDAWSKKEFALLYAVPFLTVLLMGPGLFSLDALRQRKRGATVRRKLA